MPGVLRGIPGANIDGAGSLAWRASASFSANGQRARDNNFMLDGVDNNETWLQTVVIFPSVDALDEFKLQTSTYSAEFGRSLGGVVNLQIKSGTNQFRGSAFEFLRNDAFDANNFFNNRAGRAKPDFKQNQFGGTFGGPVFREKTFFFGSYQGHRETQGQTALSTVPTMKMRSGDFSELTRTIYDPTTGQPFAGNIIPSNRIDQVANNILEQLYPEPNTAGSRGVERSGHQQLPDQSDQGAPGQSGGLQGRSQSVDRESLLRPLQLRQDASAAAGLAAARRRRIHVRRRRRQHQGAEPGVQRYPRHELEMAERVPVRLVVDQVLHDADRLPARIRPTP